jgi:endonuclease/exonuclease/phosphatase (EEP) superfamily protein YafD
MIYAIAFVPILAILLLLRTIPAVAIATSFFVLNLIPICGLYVPNPQARGLSNSTELKLLAINLWGAKNPHHDQVLKMIREKNPDIIGASEITRTWVKKLQDGLPEYPYQVIERRYGGVAILSKYPLLDSRVDYFPPIKRPRITVHFKVGDKSITMICAHPVTPKEQYAIRNGEFSEIATEAGSAGTPVIVFGDLNCSPWSYYFGKMLEQGRLNDTERGFGLQPTWNARWYFPWVPIDHCLASNDFVTLERKAGPEVGSDHLPVFVRLAFIQPPVKN